MTNFDLSIQFFLQLAVILGACRLVGYAVRYCGQPQVVGEMIAGVLLGPSLLGWLAPGLHAELFPRTLESGGGAGTMPHPLMTVIYCTAQVGLVLYMFLIGLEYRADLIRRHLRSAASVSVAGIVVPFALGAWLATVFLTDQALFGPGVGRWEAMLFLGAAMSITAFPMLARIIYERGMSGTRLGTLALTAGSIDDAAAWCLLAVVLASFNHDSAIAWFAIGGGVAYTFVVLVVLRPLLARLTPSAQRQGEVTPPKLVLVLCLLMLAAWWTDYCQIYAVFGAFILGLSMPRGIVADDLRRKLEPLTTSFLLPLFFVYSGLNTRIALVNTPTLWLIAAGVLLAACVGKGVACWAAARLNGEPNPDAMAIGALMNARGLMELIILNIGLERRVITPTLFSIMVVMAIVTTLMATPLFELVYGRHRGRASVTAEGTAEPT